MPSFASPAANAVENVASGTETRKRSMNEWIVEFLAYVKTDKSEQSKQALLFHKLALEKGQTDLANQCLSFMNDWRQTVALYHQAEHEAVREGKDGATVQATFQRAASAPFGGNTDSQVAMTLEAKSSALAAMGKLQEAREVLPQIAERYRRATATANLLLHAPDEQVDTLLKEIDELEIPEAKRKGWKLAADRIAKTGDKPRALELYRKILASAETHNNATTIEEVEAIVQPLVTHGDVENAKRAAALCLAFAQRTPVEAGWKVRDLVLAGRAFETIGQNEKAREILSKVPAMTGKTDLFQFVRMGGWAATGFLVSGQEEKFDVALRDVVAIGRQHVHHRARAMAALQVLAILLESGRPLAPVVSDELGKTALTIQKDPDAKTNSRL